MRFARFKLLFVFALALVSLAASAAPAHAQRRNKKTTKFRALTFNIRFDFKFDGDNRWEHRVDAVAKTITESGASIICLQEDKAHQVDDLKKTLAGYQFVGRGRNATGSGERCSVVFNTKHFALKDAGDFWLSDTPDVMGSNTWGDKYPRKVTWALLATRKGGRQVLVLNTHLTEGKGPKEKKLRLRGAEMIRAWLAEHVKPDKKGRVIPVIVTGDFNTDAGTKPHDELAEAADLRLRDVWEVASPPGRLPGTYNGFKGLTTKSRIDWVLVGPSVGVLGAGKIEEQVDGRWPSDHYPVYADLEIQ